MEDIPQQPAVQRRSRWRSRFGMPQLLAALLLAAFAAQAGLLVIRSPLSEDETAYLIQARQRSGGGWFPEDIGRPRLVTFFAGVLVPGATPVENDTFGLRVAMRLPFLAMGVLLGASLWYVSRRLFANVGGYITLSLYAFSPAILYRSAMVNTTIPAAWGAFGTIFTGLAVAHTLYAPREVILWNWRRILLLSISIALCTGSLFWAWPLVPLTLLFMLWVVPERRGASVLILLVASALALAMLIAAHAFNPRALWEAVNSTAPLRFNAGALTSPIAYVLIALFFIRMPGVAVLALISLTTFAVWRRSRFFGTAVPLMVTALLVLLAVVLPHAGGHQFLVLALPFLLVFIAGVFSDLLETGWRGLVVGMLAGVVVAQAIFTLTSVMRP